MSSPQIHFFDEKPLDLHHIEQTFSSAFGKSFHREGWKWRFQNNPSSERTYIAYIMEGNELAGYYAVSPVKLSFFGQDEQIALSNMTMTHPSHQGKGYFTLLAKALYARLKEEGFIGIYGFANRNSHYGFRKNLGWVDLCASTVFRLEKTSFRGIIPSESISHNVEEICSTSFLPKEKFCIGDRPINLSRDVDHLKWRLIDNPICGYHVASSSLNDKEQISIIFKKYGSSIDIMEIFWDSPTFNVELFSSCIQNLLSLGYDGINLWSNLHSTEHLMMEKLGFSESIFNSYLGCIPLCEKDKQSELLSYSNWHYRFMDSDIF
ncbi:MAG: GNAT family N-acetyltransferase [Bdellovibrionota bacterium]